MKVSMKLRHLLMATGLFISAGLVLFGDTNSSEQLSEPVVRDISTKSIQHQPVLSANATMNIDLLSAKKISQNKNNKWEPDILILLPREEVIHEGTDTDSFANNDSTLFSNQNWLPPSPPPPEPAPPPPTAPAMPFTFLGKKMEDGVWEVYLGRGNDIAIVRNNSVIDAIYRVESILPPALTMTYLPLQQTQKIAIGAAE